MTHAYVSFADEHHHLGVVVTEVRPGEQGPAILRRLIDAGLNPGGEVRMWQFEMDEPDNPIKPEHCDMLVTLPMMVEFGWEPVNLKGKTPEEVAADEAVGKAVH